MPEVQFWHLLFYERRCAVCHAPFIPDSKEKICPECVNALSDTSSRCVQCGMPVSQSEKICVQCLLNPLPWEQYITIGAYQGLLRDSILRGKFGGDSLIFTALGTMLGLKWKSKVAQSVTQGLIAVPIPLHSKRLRERGFNQSADIARAFASSLKISMRTDILTRIRNTPSQRTMNKQERTVNIQNAFSVSSDVSGLSFILIDDVMTTGATLLSAAGALINAGANVYGVASLARD